MLLLSETIKSPRKRDAEEGILVDKGLILTYLDLDYNLSLLEW